MGAVLLLLSQEARHKASVAVQDVEYIELTTYSAFQDEFIRHMAFQPI
jgi:uncharacterized 2Fe-2S/4Fe-4S cluster protein (DUF4445 family)